MNLNLDARLHDQFKVATAAQGQNMTDVITRFIEDYVRKHLPGRLRELRKSLRSRS